MSAEARLKELGLVLPALPKPVANYLPYRLAGNLLFLAGQMLIAMSGLPPHFLDETIAV
jgi:hypothetical protein